jgi:hypothetical protein
LLAAATSSALVTRLESPEYCSCERVECCILCPNEWAGECGGSL